MSDPGTTHIDLAAIGALGEQLGRQAATLHGIAGGLDRAVPAVPFDACGLQDLIRQLDEERRRFDDRLARLVAEGAEQAVLQVTYTREADL